MKDAIVAVILAAVIAATAGAGYFLLNSTEDGEIVTAVSLQDGVTCTIDGEEAADGQEITVKNDRQLRIHLESANQAILGFTGGWACGDSEVSDVRTTDTAVTSTDFILEFGKGDYKGAITAGIANADDLGTIHLTFKINESKVKVVVGGQELKNGDTYDFTGDGYIHVESKVGLKVLYCNGSWHDDTGGSGGINMSQYDTSCNFQIINVAYYGDMKGDISIGAN